MAKKIRTAITINGKIKTKYFNTIEESENWKTEVRESLNTVNYLQNEVWKPINGYSMYLASNYGRIMTLNYKKTGRKSIMKPSLSKDGYFKTMFVNDNGKCGTKPIHTLVAIAFLGERPLNKEVNHKDGNKQNNNVDNLEWCTRSENVLHAYQNGLEKALIGMSNGNSKLTDEQVRYIRLCKKNGGKHWGREKIAMQLGISSAHVKDIANSKTLWKHISV